MILTQENYYSKESDMEFMSFSLFKNLMANPARAMADLRGEYPWFSDNKALLIGQYLHSYFESKEAHEQFIEENKKELISSQGKTKGELKTDFKGAITMIERLEKEEAFNMSLLDTEREFIVQGVLRSADENGEIRDIDWKGKLDAIDIDGGYFYDFKTVKTLVDNGATWDNELHAKVNFVISRKYDEQMAIYAELLRQMFGREFTPVIWAVSKESEPLVKPYLITKPTLDAALQRVIDNQITAVNYRDGIVEAPLYNDGSNFYNYKHRILTDEDYEYL